MMMYVLTVFILLLMTNFIYGNQNKSEEAELRAALSQATSLENALVILKNSNKEGPMAFYSFDALKKEGEKIFKIAQELNKNSYPTIKPRNGGCAPRIVCEPVLIDRSLGDNIIPYPQCLEIHRCGGCCQYPQYPCVPIEQKSISFSPFIIINLNGTQKYKVIPPIILMNHTECQCKCKKTEDDCRKHGKKLNTALCQCTEPTCFPQCQANQHCQFHNTQEKPICICKRPIPGRNGAYSCPKGYQPNARCEKCVKKL